MKFETNYVFPAGEIFPLLIWASLSVCAISLGITLAMLISTSRLSAEVDVLEDRLSRYRSHEIHKPESLLSQSRLVELRTKVRALNELTGATRQSLPQLLSHIEKLLPDKVWLSELQYRARENDSRLVAESKSAEQLTVFMENLEQFGSFSQVLLMRQSLRSDKSQLVQFEIRLRGMP